MTETQPSTFGERNRARGRSVADEIPSFPYLGVMLWIASAIVAGYLLFCHGCHADVDDEALRPGSQALPVIRDAVHA
jgi:hypothetical protein